MKGITAYTIHSSGGNTIASVIYNKLNDDQKIIGMNNREEIIIKDENIRKAEEMLRSYLKSKIEE